MEQYLSLIQWLLPSGGIGALLLWLTSRSLRQSRENREVHDAYKVMYEDLKTTVTRLNSENSKLFEIIAGMERAIMRTNVCAHRGACPVRHELRKSQGGYIPDLRSLLREHEPPDALETELRKPPQRDLDALDPADEPP